MDKQKGQVILILILVVTVALVIGLSVIQKSLSDVSTSTKVEQSARAFSAAEAGIEKAIQTDKAVNFFSLGNDVKLQGVEKNDVPALGQALEYPPLSKEEVAQVWLADPDTLSNYYKQPSLDIYWGSTQATGREQPAIEIKVIYQDASGFISLPFYIDPVTGTSGQLSNGFKDPSNYGGSCSNPLLVTSLSKNSTDARAFKCKVTLSGLPNSTSGLPKLILLRARFLYNSTSQPFAVAPTGGDSLPVQAKIFTSTGVAGETQRVVQVFRLDKVVPPYFDYAIFSAGDIGK